MNIMTLFQMTFIFTFIAFSIQRAHLLLSLLCLEGMMLSLVLIIPVMLSHSNMYGATMYAIIMLTMGACEASLGLSLMVMMSRSTGSDLLKSITLNKC